MLLDLLLHSAGLGVGGLFMHEESLKEMTVNPLERRVGGSGEGDKRRLCMTQLTLGSPSVKVDIYIIVNLSN